jgi:hypothetical protein
VTPDNLRDVLAEHRWESVPSPKGLCSCGNLPATKEHFGRWVEAWRDHVADALAGAVARLIADARADALREAADAWQVGGWANVLLPKPEPPAVPAIAYSNRVLDWLRDRAALDEGGTQ